MLEIIRAERDALAAREPDLRVAAVAAARDRAEAKRSSRAAADQVRRVAGRSDLTELTADLIKEELRARRARGETIPRLGGSKAESLEILAAARRAAPSIPEGTNPIPDAPAAGPLPAAAVGAAGQTAEGAALVGRRVMATYLDEEGVSQWYPALIVEYRPDAHIYKHMIHYDADGEEVLVGFPDPTVQLLTTSVTHCKCARCLLSDPEGRRLT